MEMVHCGFMRVIYARGMNMVIEIPDRVAESLPGSPLELQREMKFALACGLFAMGEIGSGVAGEMAGLSRVGFLNEFGSRGLQRPYDENDLADDLAFARHR